MVKNYMNCINNPSNSEQFCAAMDRCCYSYFSKGEDIPDGECETSEQLASFMVDGWVSGDCDSTKPNE